MDRLRTEHLYKKYGKRTVVNDVSIYLEQGEIVGLLGPNGAGKTTTFYMTTGLVTANNGKIFLNDLDITSMPMYQRAKLGIGYLPQEASVFRKMSVEDNILSVLEMTNFTKEYQKEKLEQLIKEFNLGHVRKNLGDRLSGGERRRTEIARCLAIEPKFVMLDEPFAGVDPIAVQEIQKEWRANSSQASISPPPIVTTPTTKSDSETTPPTSPIASTVALKLGETPFRQVQPSPLTPSR